jgi:translation initiation factor IF-1
MTNGANDSSLGPDMTGKRTRAVQATVVASLPNGMFRLRMPDGREVVAHAAANLRMALVRLLAGDLVAIDVSPFDPNKARIRSLIKSTQSSQHEVHPSQPQQREQS